MPPSDPAERRNSFLPVCDGSLVDFPTDPIACMRRIHNECGDIGALVEEHQKLVFVFSPEYNQQVLSNSQQFHSQFFALRGSKRSAQRRVTSGLLTMNGEEHRRHRRIMMEPFSKGFIPNYDETTAQLVEEMLAEWSVGDVRDMNVEMTNFMRRLTSAILFGLDYPELSNRIGEMTDRWVLMNHQTGLGAFVSDPDINDRYEELLHFAEDLEDTVRELIELRRSSGKVGNDVLSILMRGHDEEGSISDDQLIGHITLTFGAAHLTTAHTLVWTLLLLAQHPSQMEKLYDELRSHPLDARVMNQKGTFAERVLRESMRVLPASSYSQRVCSETVELGPFRLNRGTPVIFSQFMTHHRPDLYDEPERFQPERWLTLSPSAYEYLPFGAGPRMCIGAPLALREMGTALPRILTRFRLAMAPNAEVNAKVISTMLGPTSPVPMEIHPADGRFEARPIRGSILDLVELPEMPAQQWRRAA